MRARRRPERAGTDRRRPRREHHIRHPDRRPGGRGARRRADLPRDGGHDRLSRSASPSHSRARRPASGLGGPGGALPLRRRRLAAGACAARRTPAGARAAVVGVRARDGGTPAAARDARWRAGNRQDQACAGAAAARSSTSAHPSPGALGARFPTAKGSRSGRSARSSRRRPGILESDGADQAVRKLRAGRRTTRRRPGRDSLARRAAAPACWRRR